MIFPWQRKQWQQLWRAKEKQGLPHALLFTGLVGLGKKHFATCLACALLCEQGVAEGGCQRCQACHLVLNRLHPNLLWIAPEKIGQAIKVDQIRQANAFIEQSSFQNNYRVVLIEPADKMNINAANALLKTLEEPSSDALIILITHQDKQLPATILSRCQRLVFSKPTVDMALNWMQTQVSDDQAALALHLAHGAPLAALALIQEKKLFMRQTLFDLFYLLHQQRENPVSAASKMIDSELSALLDFSLSWMTDVLRLQLIKSSVYIVNRDYQEQLAELQQYVSPQAGFHFVDYLQQLSKQMVAGINLNKQLMIESIFIKWVDCLCSSLIRIAI